MITPLEALDALEATNSDGRALRSTGFEDIDDVSGGFRPGQVWIVTGTPGQGRTTWAIQWAICLASVHQLRTHLISLREPEDLVAARMVANLGKVPALHIWKHEPTETDELRLAEARETLASTQMRIVGPGQISSLSVDLDPAEWPEVLIADDADLAAEASPARIAAFADKGVIVILTLPRAHIVAVTA